MPNNKLYGFLAFLVVVGIVLAQSLFIVDETKQVLVLQFGEHKRTIRKAGLYSKIPFVQQTVYFEKRVLDVDPMPERVLLAGTNDGLMAALATPAPTDGDNDTQDFNDTGSPIIVDTFARYRITDPLKFRQRLSSEEAAELRLSNELDSTTRDVMGRTTIEQLLSKERVKIMEQIKSRVNAAVSDLGIEIIDVRINRADLTENLQNATFSRMQSEREQRAAEIRSMGEKRAQEIRSNADKERTVLLAEAQRQSQILRGQGDEEATTIYSAAYKRDPGFYRFYRSLQAYKQSLGTKDTTLVLSPDSDFFQTFKDAGK